MLTITRRVTRRLTTEQKATTGFVAALFILLISAIASRRSTQELVRSADWVAHTHEVIATLNEIVTGVMLVEDAERGVLLEGNGHDPARDLTRDLTRLQSASASLPTQLTRLQALTADNPAQHARAVALQSLVRAELTSASLSVELRRPNEDDGAVDRILAGAATLRSEEERLLSSRTAREHQIVALTITISVVGFFLTFIVAGLATMVTRRDVRERKRAEAEALRAKEAAEAASRTKSAFMATMSHELRTPLNSVIGFTRVLMKNKNGKLGELELSYLDSIHANGKHLLNLINDVLDLSKIEARRIELELAPVRLDQLIAETIAQFQREHQRDQAAKAVELRMSVPEVVAPIETDAGKMKQVLINLIGNALKFTEAGTVGVRLRVDPDTRRPFRIDVVDTGIGIPADRLDAIFEAFEQADRGTARQFGGTGLGLTISRSLCQMMGHLLQVSSVVGKGTTFSILLASDVKLTPRWTKRVGSTPKANAAVS